MIRQEIYETFFSAWRFVDWRVTACEQLHGHYQLINLIRIPGGRKISESSIIDASSINPLFQFRRVGDSLRLHAHTPSAANDNQNLIGTPVTSISGV
jgi:hypothetical protein